MISAIYKNRLRYYSLLKDFLEHEIKAFSFMRKFMHKRSDDIDEDIKAGYYDYIEEWGDNELKFRREYYDKLYRYAPTEDITKILNKYVEGAKKYEIKGDLFFSGIFSDLSINIRDFYPRDRKEAEVAGWDDSFLEFSAEEYKAEYYIDETELRKKIQEKFNILEENKEMWM
jgi:hypothetical protein